jgi:hypothetical protein
MPSTETMLPPWVRPEAPENIQLLDDQSQMFEPAFSRNSPQVQSWSDPRWLLKRKYTAVRLDERSMLNSTILEARGRVIPIRVFPQAPLRGSFPATELITNNSFVNSVQGWIVSDVSLTLSASERVLRVTHANVGDTVVGPGAATVVANAPYVLRAMFRLGRESGAGPTWSLRIGTSSFSNEVSEGATFATDGYKTLIGVPNTTTIYPGLVWYRSAYGNMANDFYSLQYTSLARCMLIDVGANKLARSQELSDVYWNRVGLASIATNTTAPDGGATADVLTETTSAQPHYIVNSSPITVLSSILDYAYSAALKAGTRSIARLSLQEVTSSTAIQAWFNLNSGTVVANTLGTNWANLRTFTNSLGNGWWECSIVGQKRNSAVQLFAFVALASSNAADSYTGNGSTLTAWRPTLSQSSVPGRLIQTTASQDDGGSPNGGACHIKGAPASLNGLLLPYDWVEIITTTGSELKQVTAPLNTDANGRGYLQFRPGLSGLAGADAPVIVLEPSGRFKLKNGVASDNRWGLYQDAELELTEYYGS